MLDINTKCCCPQLNIEFYKQKWENLESRKNPTNTTCLWETYHKFSKNLSQFTGFLQTYKHQLQKSKTIKPRKYSKITQITKITGFLTNPLYIYKT